MFLYIAGRGHSGSTIADLALTQDQAMTGFGELLSGLGRDGELCGCGLLASECEYWESIAKAGDLVSNSSNSESKSLLKALGSLLNHHSRIVRYPFYWVAPKRILSKVAGSYFLATRKMYDLALESASSKHVVESSKEVTRALLLLRGMDDVLIIHLVRDPAAMLASNMYRVSKGSGFRFMRRSFSSSSFRPLYVFIASFGWLVGNFMVEALRVYSKGNLVRVKYEDICDAPESFVALIEEKIDEPLPFALKFLNGEVGAKQTHGVAGNRERKKQEVRFDRKRAASRDGLKPWERFAVKIITAPLRWVYGY